MASFAQLSRTAAAFLALCAAGVLAPAGRAGAADLQPLVVRSDVLDRPLLAATVNAQAGEAVIEKGRQNTYDGLELSNELIWGGGIFQKFTIGPGKLKASQRDAKYIYYFSDRMTVEDRPRPVMAYPDGGLCVEIANPANIRMFFNAGQCGKSTKTPPIVRPTQVVDLDPASPYQALIYSGRSGDWVTFIYRQASGGPARPSASQEVRFDLTKDTTVEFEGARIEILDAIPERLTYRVVATFPDPVP